MLADPYVLSVLCAVVVTFAFLFRSKRMEPAAPIIRSAAAVHDAAVKLLDRMPLVVVLGTLAALFLAQLILVDHMQRSINSAALAGKPWPVMFADYIPFTEHLRSPQRRLYDVLFAALTVAQATALIALFRNASRVAISGARAAVLAVGGVAIIGLALSSRVIVSSDVYGYISSAKLGFSAYSGAPAIYAGDFAALNEIDYLSWVKLPACPYGPLWLGLNALILAPIHTLWGAILVERGLGLLATIACAWAIKKLHSFALAMTFLLNPMVLFNYVVEGHNDIMALACVLTAAAFLRSVPLLGMVLQAAAGLTKLPYLVLAVLAADSRRTARARLGYFIGACVLTVVISARFGGVQYLHALLFHTNERRPHHASIDAIAHLVAAILSAVALGFAVFGRRYFAQAVPLFSSLAVVLFPWYLAMIVPYAVIGEAAPLTFIATLPMHALFVDVLLGTHLVKILLAAAVLIWCGFAWAARASRPARSTVGGGRLEKPQAHDLNDRLTVWLGRTSSSPKSDDLDPAAASPSERRDSKLD